MNFTLILLIPALTAIGENIAFFTVISILIAAALFVYFKRFKRMSFYEKIFKGLELLLLFVHHSAFVLMCWAENATKYAWIPEAMRYCGLIVIFTIFIGGFLDILGFILQILISFVKFIIKMRRLFLKKKLKNPRLSKK